MDLDLQQTVNTRLSEKLFPLLGSFWGEQFQDREVVRQIVRATADMGVQADLDLKEQLSVARDLPNAPLYHREIWWRLVLTAQDMVDEHPRVLPYSPLNSAYSEANGPYGASTPLLWSFGVPEKLVRVRCITNRITNATFVGLHGEAFFHRPGVLGFRKNPLQDSSFQTIETENGPGVVLWLYMSDWDAGLLTQYYSIPTQVAAPTSESYRRTLLGAWNARVRGPSRGALNDLISGATGVPLCETDNELVEWVGRDGPALVVVTDKRAYSFPSDHNAVVAVGDRLLAGQAMTDALSVKEVSNLQSGEEAVAVPASFFAPQMNIQGPIVFPNVRVPVQDLGLDNEGNRVVGFELHGAGSDITKYRRESARMGIAHVLDRRGPNAPTEPSAADLWPTVNPATELVRELTRPNLILVTGDRSRWPAPQALQESLERQLGLLMPNHGRVVFQDRSLLDLAYDYSSQSGSSFSTESTASSDESSSSTSGSSSSRSEVSTSSRSDVSTSSEVTNSLSSVSSGSSASGSSVSGSTASSNTSSSSSSRSSRSSGSDVSTSSSSYSSQSSSLTSATSRSSATDSSNTSSHSSWSTASDSSWSVFISQSSLRSDSSDSTAGTTNSSSSSTPSRSSNSSGYFPEIELHLGTEIKRSLDCGATYVSDGLLTAPGGAGTPYTVAVMADRAGHEQWRSDYAGLVFVTANNAVDGNRSKFGVTYRSADAGKTWSLLDYRFDAMAFKSGPSGFILGFRGDRAYRSDDRGLTWSFYSNVGLQPVNPADASSSHSSAGVDPGEEMDVDRTVLAAAYSPEHDTFVVVGRTGVLHSEDNGLVWIPQTPVSHPFGPAIGGHQVKYAKGVFVMSRDHRVCRSVDGGRTWGDYYTLRDLSNYQYRGVTGFDYLWGAGKWVLFGENLTTTSTDGRTWEIPTALPEVYAGQHFITGSNPHTFSPAVVSYATIAPCDDPSSWLVVQRYAFGSNISSKLLRTTNGGLTYVVVSASTPKWALRLTPVASIPGTSSSSSSGDFQLFLSSSSSQSEVTSSPTTDSPSSRSSGDYQQLVYVRGANYTSNLDDMTTGSNTLAEIVIGAPETGFRPLCTFSNVDNGQGYVLGYCPTRRWGEYFVVWKSNTSSAKNGFYRTTNSGQSWTHLGGTLYSTAFHFGQAVPDGAGGWNALFFPYNSNRYYVVGSSGVLVNGTILPTPNSVSPGRIAYKRSGSSYTVMYGGQAKVLVSTDGGRTFPTSYNITGNVLDLLHIDGQTWIAATTSGFFRTTNDGSSWSTISGLSGYNFSFDASEDGTVLAFSQTYKDVYRSTDFGASWSLASSSLPFSLPSSQLGSTIVHLGGSTWLISGATSSDSTQFAISYDDGSTWEAWNPAITNSAPYLLYRALGVERAAEWKLESITSSSTSGDNAGNSTSSDLDFLQRDTSSSSTSSGTSATNSSATSDSESTASDESSSSRSSGSPSSASPVSNSSQSDRSTGSSAVTASSVSSGSSMSTRSLSSWSTASTSSRSSLSSYSDISSKSSRSDQTSRSESSRTDSTASLSSNSSSSSADNVGNSTSSNSTSSDENTSSSSWPSSQSSRSESSRSFSSLST